MDLSWHGRHIRLNDIDLYISPTSEAVKIGVHATQEFIPLLGFQDLESAIQFVVRVSDLLGTHIVQKGNAEVPEVFKRAFDADDSVSGRKH